MRRILFVDDEPRILEGLQRMLRARRKQWDMAFATSGSEALAMLAESSYDIIVSDMRMPEMDGAQLLALVRERYPGMIRIVLSGHFETEAAMRAVPVAHQFLTKPCDAQRLQAVIERSFDSDVMVPDEATRGVIAAIGELPPLPNTYSALVAALNDPETSLDQVGAIVQSDVAVAAKVLQLVNSAFFGLAHEVATVPMAVGYLGFDVLKQLVLTVELFRSFAGRTEVPGFSPAEVQLHSRCVAALAARLPVRPRQVTEVSVAALLHDVGKLILAVRLPGLFAPAFHVSIREARPLYSVEEQMHGTSHAEIGAYLLALWGLTPAIVAAVSRHHHPIWRPEGNPDGQYMDLSLAVHVADLLAHEAAGSRTAPDEAGLGEALRDWSELLPVWRNMAREIVQREGAEQ